jgi:hypothetical protein
MKEKASVSKETDAKTEEVCCRWECENIFIIM